MKDKQKTCYFCPQDVSAEQWIRCDAETHENQILTRENVGGGGAAGGGGGGGGPGIFGVPPFYSICTGCLTLKDTHTHTHHTLS